MTSSKIALTIHSILLGTKNATGSPANLFNNSFNTSRH